VSRPTTRTQRCWVHKTANVLNKLPRGLQGEVIAGVEFVDGVRKSAA
jgi:transposase-like protein